MLERENLQRGTWLSLSRIFYFRDYFFICQQFVLIVASSADTRGQMLTITYFRCVVQYRHFLCCLALPGFVRPL